MVLNNATKLMLGDREVIARYQGDKQVWTDNMYRQVEYLKSTGTQYILTDIVPEVTFKTEVEMKLDAFLTYMSNGNSRVIGTSGYGVQFGTNADASYITFLLGHGWVSPTDYQIKNPPNFTARGLLTVCRGVNASSWNSTKISVTKPVTVTPSDPIVIFGYNAGTILWPYNCYEIRMHSVKIYDENNNLIHNLIPTERTSDGELGLYDTLTDKFYTNAGTGTFEKGSYVEKEET